MREFGFLQPARVTLLTERRTHAPWGLLGAESGKTGRNLLNGQEIKAKQSLALAPGDVLTIETAGGGGWGKVVESGE